MRMVIRVSGLQAKGRPRFARRGNHVSAYTPKNTAEYEEKIRCEYLAAKDREAWLNGEPIEVRVTAYKKIPSSASKKERLRIKVERVRPVTKPDVDNYLKIALDALNGVAYADDNQVVRAVAEKCYSDGEAYMEIELKRATEQEKKEGE